MNKLQLYIAKSLRGYKGLVNFNSTEEVRRHIHDQRTALENIQYDPLEKNIFYLVEYIPEGTLLSILRTIPTEPLDHLAATVFVPADLLVTAEELDEVVRDITRKMSAPGMSSADVGALRQLFAREYPERAAGDRGALTPSSAAGGYARCNYGGMSGRRLADYFGPHLYQPDWTPFAGVLLLDADLGLDGIAVDISREPLNDTARQHTPATPHIPAARREADSDAVRTLTAASFNITSRTDRSPLEGCVITVNGITIDGEHTFAEAELSPAAVTVTCAGYAPFSGRVNLAGSAVAHIRLDASGRIYRFQMPVRSTEYGAPVNFEIRSKHAVTESPVEGYDALDTIREGAGRINMLAYSGGSSGGMRRLLIAAACGLVVGLLLGFCLFAGGDDETVGARETTEAAADAADSAAVPAVVQPAVEQPAPVREEAVKAEAPAPAAAPAATEQSVAAAVKYLDEHRSWNRVEMEKYAALAGLFDDMNALRLDELRGKWAEKLKDSKNFGAVVRAAEGSQRKKVNVHRDKRDTYNKPGDDAIGYVGYTYWIDP